MRRSYKVLSRGRGDIASSAAKARRLGRIGFKWSFDVVRFVEEVLVPHLEGGLDVVPFDERPAGSPPAFVTFSPNKMHVHRPVWEFVKYHNHDFSRFIIAHEIGHLILHRDQAMAFSSQLTAVPTFYPEHQCSEWQANTFALYFLVPAEIVEQLNDSDAIAELCHVPPELASEAVAQFRDKERRARGAMSYDGDACPNCGNFSLVRSGNFLSCTTCIKAMEGSHLQKAR